MTSNTIPQQDLLREIACLLARGLSFEAHKGARLSGRRLSLDIVPRFKEATAPGVILVHLVPRDLLADLTRSQATEALLLLAKREDSDPETQGKTQRRIQERIERVFGDPERPRVSRADLNGIDLTLKTSQPAREWTVTTEGGVARFTGVAADSLCWLSAPDLVADFFQPGAAKFSAPAAGALAEQLASADQAERDLGVMEVKAWGAVAAQSEEFLNHLAGLLGADRPAVRCTAALALGALGPAAARSEPVLTGLAGLLADPLLGWSEGVAAVQVLGPAAAQPPILKALLGLLRNPDAAICRSGAEGVAALGQKAAAEEYLAPALQALLQHRSPSVKEAARRALEKLQSATVQPEAEPAGEPFPQEDPEEDEARLPRGEDVRRVADYELAEELGRRGMITARVRRVLAARYELFEELGRGGMGVVYKARDVPLSRLVALKVILPGEHTDRAALARVQAEATVVARLQHPGIVQIYDVGEYDGLPYLSEQLVTGGSLASRLDGKAWPVERAAALIESLARAVHDAHKHAIIHGDLNPRNVLLAEDGHPMIVDFGLARCLGSAHGQKQPGAFVGRPDYMAPEQWLMPQDADSRADIYALGVVLYELLTGRLPFKAETRQATLLAGQLDEPVPVRRLVPKVPRYLEAVCLRCLQKDPARRYPSAEALAEDLRRFREGRPMLARLAAAAAAALPVETLKRLWRSYGPGLVELTAAVLLMVMVAAGAGIFYFATKRNGDEAHEKALLEASASGEAEAEKKYEAARIALREAAEVARGPVGEVPGNERVRRDMLERIAASFKSLSQSDHSSEVALELAEVNRYLAEVYATAGQPKKADQAALRAKDWLQKGVGENNPRYGREEAELHLAYGRVLYERGELKEAVDWLKGGYELAEKAASAPDAGSEEKISLAKLGGLLGAAECALDRVEDALHHLYRAAHAVEVIADTPKGKAASLRLTLSAILGHLAHAERQAGRLDVAEAIARKALEVGRSVAGRSEAIALAQEARNLHLLADILLDAGQLDDAQRLIKQHGGVVRNLLKGWPENTSYLRLKAEQLALRARWYYSIGHQKDAQQAARDAAEVLDGLASRSGDTPALCHDRSWYRLFLPADLSQKEAETALGLARRALELTMREEGKGTGQSGRDADDVASSYYRTLGVAAYRRGDFRDAAEALSQAVRRWPRDAERQFYLAMAESKSGRAGAAAKMAYTTAREAMAGTPRRAELRHLREEAAQTLEQNGVDVPEGR